MLAIVRAAIDGASAARLLNRAFDRHGVPAGPVRVISAGKASAAMARVAAERLLSRARSGLVVAPRSENVPLDFELIVGGHPMPTTGSEQAGRAALALARSLSPDDTLLVLLSGGASALMAVPAETLTLEDKCAVTACLLRSGADIHALNAVRKHVSAIKGGRLAAATAARCLTYAVSDVVGDEVSVIGSGPTVGDPSTYADACRVLDGCSPGALPRHVVQYLESGKRGELSETPKPGDPRLARSHAEVIGGRNDACEAAAATARRLDYHVVVNRAPVVGEARVVAHDLMRGIAVSATTAPRPACFISGGETTVRVVGNGRGGRNQEFALAATRLVRELGDDVSLASVGSDGLDGPTDAAGAIADSTTLERARVCGLAAPERFLEDNDAYGFFEPLGDLIHFGPTDTNVGDIQIVLVG